MMPDYAAWTALWNVLLAGEHAQPQSRETAALAAIEQCLRALAAQVDGTEKVVAAASQQAAEYWKTWAELSTMAGAGNPLSKAHATAHELAVGCRRAVRDSSAGCCWSELA